MIDGLVEGQYITNTLNFTFDVICLYRNILLKLEKKSHIILDRTIPRKISPKI